MQAARTGDFEEFTTPEAFKLDAVVTAFDDDGRSPIALEIRGLPGRERHQVLYDRLLDMMPDLTSGAARYKELWAGSFSSLMRSLMRIGDVSRVRENPAARLTVIEASEPLDRMARFSVARHHRVLTATRAEGGWTYEHAGSAARRPLRSGANGGGVRGARDGRRRPVDLHGRRLARRPPVSRRTGRRSRPQLAAARTVEEGLARICAARP